MVAESASIRQELSGNIGSRYRIVRCLGQGGMGAVYEVEDTVLSRRRALKTLLPELGSQPEMRRRFQAEIDALKLIQHEAIVDIVDVGFHPELGFPFLVMERLEGENLEELVKSRGTLDSASTLKILTQVANGLDAIHASNIVHRDLKPSNVFIERRANGLAEVKLLDFGIAKILDTGAGNTTLIAGTPGYMAPEQFEGQGIDQRTDIYALGKLARAMLCGLASVAAPRGANTVGLPAAFDQWFATATAWNKDERFARASLAVEALSVALGVPKRASYIEWAELHVALASTELVPSLPTTEVSVSGASSSVSAIPVSSSAVRARQGRVHQQRTLVWALGVGLLLLVTSSAWWLRREQTAASAPPQVDAALPAPADAIKTIHSTPSVPPPATHEAPPAPPTNAPPAASDAPKDLRQADSERVPAPTSIKTAKPVTRVNEAKGTPSPKKVPVPAKTQPVKTEPATSEPAKSKKASDNFD